MKTILLFSYVLGIAVTRILATLHCPERWHQIRDKCYRYEYDEINFNEAEIICRIHLGGQLATIKDLATQKQIVNTFFKQAMIHERIPAWIGVLPVHCLEGKFATKERYWLGEETKMDFKNFHLYEENYCEEFDGVNRTICTALNVEKYENALGEWFYRDCKSEASFICEKDPKVIDTEETEARAAVEKRTIVTISPIMIVMLILVVVALLGAIKFGRFGESSIRFTK